MAKIKLTKKQKESLRRMAKTGLIAYNPKGEGGETKVKGKKAAGPLTAEEVRRFRKYDLEQRTKQAKGPRMKRRMAKRKVNPMESDEELSRLAHQKIDEEQRQALWDMATYASLPADIFVGPGLIKHGVKWVGKKFAKAKAKRAAAKSLKKLKKGGVTRAAGRPAFKGRTEAAPKPAGKPKKRRTSPQQRTPGRGVVSGRTHRTSPSHMRPDGTTSPRLPAVDVLKNAGIRNADKMSDVQQRAALATLFGGKAAAVAAAKTAGKKVVKKAAAKAKPKKAATKTVRKPTPHQKMLLKKHGQKVPKTEAEARKILNEKVLPNIPPLPPRAAAGKQATKAATKATGKKTVTKAAKTAPKGPSVAAQKAAVAKMTDNQLKKILKAGNVTWRSREQAIKVVRKRIARDARAAKPKGGAKPRPQRRTAAAKGKPATKPAGKPRAAKPATKPAAKPTTKPAAAAKPKSLAGDIKMAKKDRAKMDQFFYENGITSRRDLLRKRYTLVGQLKQANLRLARALERQINKMTTLAGKTGTSAVPKARGARPSVAGGQTTAQIRRGKAARGQMRREGLEDIAARAPRVQAVTGKVKGIRKIILDNAAGRITSAQAEKSIGTLLSKAPKALASEIRRLMRAAQDMGIAARKAKGVQRKSLEADQKKAVSQLNKLIMSLLATAGLGASAE